VPELFKRRRPPLIRPLRPRPALAAATHAVYPGAHGGRHGRQRPMALARRRHGDAGGV